MDAVTDQPSQPIKSIQFLALCLLAATLTACTSPSSITTSGPAVYNPYTLMDNAKAVSTALKLYISDNDNIFPNTEDQDTFRSTLLPYVKNETVVADDPDHQTHIVYNVKLANVKSTKITDPTQVVAFYTPFSESATGQISHYLVGFADAHTESIDPATWKNRYEPTLKPNP